MQRCFCGGKVERAGEKAMKCSREGCGAEFRKKADGKIYQAEIFTAKNDQLARNFFQQINNLGAM